MHGKLIAAEEELRKLKVRTGLASPESQRELMVARAGRLEDELLNTAADFSSTEIQVRQLARKDRHIAQDDNDLANGRHAQPQRGLNAQRTLSTSDGRAGFDFEIHG